MRLQHQTQVDASPEDVWDFLQDTRAVVRCLPGAELIDELGDDRYRGQLRVAVGPLKMSYTGDVSVIERSPAERRIVLDASGRDRRGAGSVQAHVRLDVNPADAGSRIDVVSDVDLTGRIASLGRGVRDVSNRMFVEFAGQLGAQVEGGPAAAPLAPAPEGDQPTKRVDATVASAGTTARTAALPTGTTAGEIKVLPLVWTITRERLADLLDRLSRRVRPR